MAFHDHRSRQHRIASHDSLGASPLLRVGFTRFAVVPRLAEDAVGAHELTANLVQSRAIAHAPQVVRHLERVLNAHLCSTAQHSTAQYSTAQHSTVQHSTAQHSTAQYSTAQQRSRAEQSTAQHSAAQHQIRSDHPSSCIGRWFVRSFMLAGAGASSRSHERDENPNICALSFVHTSTQVCVRVRVCVRVCVCVCIKTRNTNPVSIATLGFSPFLIFFGYILARADAASIPPMVSDNTRYPSHPIPSLITSHPNLIPANLATSFLKLNSCAHNRKKST